MNIEEAFGLVLKKYRKEKKISQETLAFHCDLDRTYISLLERGQRNPTLNTIFSISSSLGIKPSKMVEEVDKLIK